MTKRDTPVSSLISQATQLAGPQGIKLIQLDTDGVICPGYEKPSISHFKKSLIMYRILTIPVS